VRPFVQWHTFERQVNARLSVIGVRRHYMENRGVLGEAEAQAIFGGLFAHATEG